MAIEAVLDRVGSEESHTSRWSKAGTSVAAGDVFEIDLSTWVGTSSPGVELLYLRVTGASPATRVDPSFHSTSTVSTATRVYQPLWTVDADADLAFTAGDGPVFLPLTSGKIFLAPVVDATADCTVEVILRRISR